MRFPRQSMATKTMLNVVRMCKQYPTMESTSCSAKDVIPNAKPLLYSPVGLYLKAGKNGPERLPKVINSGA